MIEAGAGRLPRTSARPAGTVDRRRRPAMLLLRMAAAAVAVCGHCLAAGAAPDCRDGWLAYARGIDVAPSLEMAENPGSILVVDRCPPNEVDVEWVASSSAGRLVLASGVLRKTAKGLDLDVTAKLAGNFAIGQRVRAPVIQAIDGARTRYAAGRNSNVERFYPYDWKSGNHEGVAEQNGATESRKSKPATTVSVDLALPGVRVGQYYFVQASDELSLTEIVTSQRDAEARLLLTSAMPSPNGDDASTHRTLRAGERVEMPVLVASDLKTVDDAKWGSSPPMAERVTDVPVKGWSAEGYNLPADTYRMIAKQLAGSFDGVILRTMAPEKWVADIFRQQGLRVYLYQYWAAARILDNNGTLPRGVRPQWALHETGAGNAGPAYTAPTPNGAWQLLDVRKPEVRAYFVQVARDVVANGWDGVFYDGPYFWADSKGRVGGAAEACPRPGSADCISFSYARAKMLIDVKMAMLDIAPSAKLGVLVGIRYFDQLHIADYLLRENINISWVTVTSDALTAEADYSPLLSQSWLINEMPYIKGNLFLGGKSANPLIDKSEIYWADSAPKNIAIDIGDFYPKTVDIFAQLLGDAGRHLNDNRIVRILPGDTLIRGTGVSLLRVIKPATITLEHAAPAIDLKAWRYLGYLDTYHLDPAGLYVIAERSGAGPIHYSGERFAWFAPDLYLAGELRFAGPPERTAGAITVHGEAIGGGALKLWSPVPPKTVLANGKAIQFARTARYWEFTAPKDLSVLEIDF
jgi:hypothetical protein